MRAGALSQKDDCFCFFFWYIERVHRSRYLLIDNQCYDDPLFKHLVFCKSCNSLIKLIIDNKVWSTYYKTARNNYIWKTIFKFNLISRNIKKTQMARSNISIWQYAIRCILLIWRIRAMQLLFCFYNSR